MSFLPIDVTRVAEILPQIGQELTIVNIMGANVLVIQGARVSANMALTMLDQIIWSPHI